MSDNRIVLQSDLAGVWYTDDPAQLDAEMDTFIREIRQNKLDRVIALLMPHAAYQYSGQVAAHSIRQIDGGSYDRVIVIGPSHQVPLLNSVSIPNVTHIETIFGPIELDRNFIYKLWSSPLFKSRKDAHEHEHSVQIELPFLQHVLGSFKLVPIVAGSLDADSAREIAQVLLDTMDSKTLVVISSDFTHYGAAFDYLPFQEDVEAGIKALDMDAFEFIQRKDRRGFIDYLSSTGATICGHGPISILISMLPKNAEVKLLKYATSGHVTGDWTRSVSYVAAACTGEWEKKKLEPEAPEEKVVVKFDEFLTAGAKKALLRIARKSLSHYLRTWEHIRDSELNVPIIDSMKQPVGAFVTLKKRGELRGCIGEVQTTEPLYKVISGRAVDAGLRDPRFERVTEEELNELVFEISVLSSPMKVESYEDIEIGKHGIVLTKGGRTAVFLPQVPVEQGWDLPQTLSQLAMKAGLCSDDWERDCTFEVFEGIAFSDELKASARGASEDSLALRETEPVQEPPNPQ